jgi:pyrroline-5-carboxylate reductase
MGAAIVASLRQATRLPLEVHLMIAQPDLFLEEFVDAGSDSFLVHWEGNDNLHRTVHRVTELGKHVGVAINPATPAAVLEEILQDVEQVLVMTVNPGFGHQHFIHTTLPKIRRVSQMIARINARCDLEVDGGIDATTKQSNHRQTRTESPMQLGMVGLGRMGANMVRRLIKGGHECVVFDRSANAVKELEKEGAIGAGSLADFVKRLKQPRAVWLMVPAAVVDETIADTVSSLRRRHPPRQGSRDERDPLRGRRH